MRRVGRARRKGENVACDKRRGKGRKIEGLKGGEEYTERRRVCDTTEGEGGKGQNMKEEN